MERDKLIEKANKDLEDFIAGLKPKKYEEGWPEANWEEEMEKYPLFRNKPLEAGEEVPPLIEALQQLKYDPDENSSEGNYRSSLKDATNAKTFKPNHLKAVLRGAYCCLELKLFEDCITWCIEGLNSDPENKKLQELIEKAKNEMKIYECNQRKAFLRERKKHYEEETLKKAIEVRHIKIFTEDPENSWKISDLEPIHPAAINKVYLDDSKNLVWPVVFAYPEVGEIDFIQKFQDNTSFYDHLTMMFGTSENRPEWDLQNRYIPELLQVHFEDKKEDYLISINSHSILKDVLCHERFCIQNGTPSFIIMVKDSEFERSFRRRYKDFH